MKKKFMEGPKAKEKFEGTIMALFQMKKMEFAEKIKKNTKKARIRPLCRVPHPFAVFGKGAGVDSVLSVRPFGQFSTLRSNGINKVIDTPCIFLLSSPVYAEAHPRRIAAPVIPPAH